MGAPLWGPATKNEARQWLNTHQAYFLIDGTYNEGIKQTIQVIDPIDGSSSDKEVPVLDGETGERTFNVVPYQFVDPWEITFAVTIWGRETGNPTDELEDAEALIFEDLQTFLDFNGISTIGHNTRTLAEVEAYVVANTP